MRVLALAAVSALVLAAPAVAQMQPGPAPDPNAPGNAALRSAGDAQGALAKGHNSFTKGQARDRMTKAGYADISNLSLDQDGVWRASATRNGQPVNLALDYKGALVAQ